MNKHIVSLIPARGGSKGIKNKNIIPVAGKPLISYTIEHSLNTKRIQRTFVSTDDDEIAHISEECGAEIIYRPASIAQDHSSSESAISHAISYFEDHNIKVDIIVFLQCTSPLRRKHDIDDAIETMIAKEYDSLLSVTENKFFLWKEEANGVIHPINYDFRKRPRRQEREKEYIENGSMYIFSKDKFKIENNRLFGRIGVHKMPYMYSFEIDDTIDLWICEQLIKKERML